MSTPTPISGNPIKEEPGSQIDLVLVIDETGSMGRVIEKVKEAIQNILERIAKFPHCASLRYGLVSYRDHSDNWAVQCKVPFTQNMAEMLLGVNNLSPDGVPINLLKSMKQCIICNIDH